MKMMLSLGWLFIAIVHTAEPRISDNFRDCREYFYKGQLPQGFDQNTRPSSLAYICQQYGNKVYFASLYDRIMRIPLYSAYILDRRSKCKLDKKKNTFDIEPQLVNMQLDNNMQRESEVRKQMGRPGNQRRRIVSSQAVNADYVRTGYDRGHLNPRCHHEDQDGQNATFTLTNVVPMNLVFNRHEWRVYEDKMLHKAKECTNMYVVTGIVPDDKWIKNKRVNIPRHIWSAYCCVDNNGKLRSGAGIRENNSTKSTVNEMGMNAFVNMLQLMLPPGNDISIFQNNCS